MKLCKTPNELDKLSNDAIHLSQWLYSLNDKNIEKEAEQKLAQVYIQLHS